MAFFGAYAVHIILNYWLANRLSGFRWSDENKREAVEYLAVIGIVFLGFLVLTGWPPLAIGLAAIVWSVVHSTRILVQLVSLDRLPHSVARLLRVLRLAPAEPQASGPVGP